MKRTRRIEVVRFSRRVTVSQRGISVEQAEDPETEFPEILGVVSPPTEEPSNDKIRAVGIAPPRTAFLRRRLLKVGVTPGPRRIVNKIKETTKMKKRVFKTTAFVVLATMLAMTVAQGLAPAQELNLENAEHSNGNKAIEGTWQVQVTIRNCLTGDPIATFPSLVTYGGGGTVIATTSSISPALNSPGQGFWEYVGDQHYTGGYMFFRFNASGTFIGTQKIAQEIEYDRALDQLNITATFEVLDPNGNVVGAGCVTAVGTRFGG